MAIIALTTRTGARKIPADHNNPATWFRRGEVARLLGVSGHAVLYAERIGALHPIIDDHGDKLFDPDEVNAYAVSHPRRAGARFMNDGEIAAEAAKLFAAGCGRREVVMTLRITFARVDELYIEWMKGDDLRVTSKLREEQLEAERLQREEEKRSRVRVARIRRAAQLMSTSPKR